MLYLKNSLVNLTIILISLFFLTVSSGDDNTFIFPKKKIITIKPLEKKKIIILLQKYKFSNKTAETAENVRKVQNRKKTYRNC